MRPRAWEVATSAGALAVVGLVALALLWSGSGPYEDIARQAGRESVEFRRIDGGGTVRMDPSSLLRFHDGWVAYVTGRAAHQPADGTPWFTDDERRHMVDVRGVFVGVQAAAAVAAGAFGWLARRAARRRALARFVRDGAITGGLGVAAVALIAAVAFQAFFLTFHQVFFPQGNFLFAAESNLLALYPEPYWYGITVRIGVSFVALAAAVALGAQVALRRSSSR